MTDIDSSRRGQLLFSDSALCNRGWRPLSVQSRQLGQSSSRGLSPLHRPAAADQLTTAPPVTHDTTRDLTPSSHSSLSLGRRRLSRCESLPRDGSRPAVLRPAHRAALRLLPRGTQTRAAAARGQGRRLRLRAARPASSGSPEALLLQREPRGAAGRERMPRGRPATEKKKRPCARPCGPASRWCRVCGV